MIEPSYSVKCPKCETGYIDVPDKVNLKSMCGNCGTVVEFSLEGSEVVMRVVKDDNHAHAN